MTGSAGAKQAADYIADRLQKAQLKPAGDNNTFFQKFEFNAGVKVLKEKNEFVLSREYDQPNRSGSRSRRISRRFRSRRTRRSTARLYLSATACPCRAREPKATIRMPGWM